MLDSLQTKGDGITRFRTLVEKGKWKAVAERNGERIKEVNCLDFKGASIMRGVMINEFWNNQLN